MRSTRNLLKLNIFVLSTLVGTAALADGELRRSFPFGSGDLLQIDTDRGHVEVRTESRDDVLVEISVSRGDLADYLDVTFDDGSGLRIEGRKVRGSSDRGNVRFEIRAPRWMDLRVKTSGGHVSVGDVDGEVTLETGGGHISVGDVRGPLEVRTAGGHIEAGSVEDAVTLRTGGGHIEMGDAAGDVNVRTGGGHISLGSAEGDVVARTSGGHIRTERVSGDMELRSSGGHVEVNGCAGDVDAKTAGGEIVLEAMEGYVSADTGGGDIRVSLAPGNRAGADLRSADDGDIVLELPEGLGVDIDASASGIVETDLSFEGTRSRDRLDGRIGAGGSRIRIRAEDGDIRIVSGGR